MDEKLRATIEHEIRCIRQAINRGKPAGADYWEGYIAALEWVLLQADKEVTP